jgi:transposase-like protein
MLISSNKFDKSESKYECDRCKKELSINTRISIYTKVAYDNPRKRWDLCQKCYTALVRGINKNK